MSLDVVRKALIVVSPDIDIPGVDIDQKSWLLYLNSVAGGAWTPDEIMVARKYTARQLKEQVKWASDCDYSFTAFSGHGYSKSETNIVLCLGRREEIGAHELLTDAEKQTLVLDCCRMPVEVQVEIVEAAPVKPTLEGHVERTAARILFDQQIEDCDAGIVRLTGCADNEKAGENETYGGLYTHALIKSGRRGTPAVGAVIDVCAAHAQAKAEVRKLNPRQTPTGQYDRSGNKFPFGIRI
jgi:hypothetical protein